MAEEHPEDLKDRGNEALRDGRFGAAVELYTRALALDGTNHVYHCNRAIAHARMGNHAAALRDASAAIDNKRDYGKAFNVKGNALLSLGRLEEALTTFERGLEVDGSNSNLRDNAAEVRSRIARRDAPPPAAGTPPPSPAQAVPSGILQRVILAGSAATLLLTVFFALPLQFVLPAWSRVTAWIYPAILIIVAVSNMLRLLSMYGRPQFNAEVRKPDVLFTADRCTQSLRVQYAMRVMSDPRAHLAVLPFVFLLTRPMLLALVPIASLEILTALDWLYSIARTASPPIARSMGNAAMGVLKYIPSPRPWDSMPIAQRWSAVNERAMQMNALVEVMLGFMLILELLTPQRSIMAVVLVWQTLQMRFMSSHHTRAAFTTVDARITSLTQHRMCPAVVHQGYVALRGLLRSQVKTPEEMQAEAARAAAGGADATGAGGGLGAGMAAAMRNCVIM